MATRDPISNDSRPQAKRINDFIFHATPKQRYAERVMTRVPLRIPSATHDFLDLHNQNRRSTRKHLYPPPASCDSTAAIFAIGHVKGS